MADEGGSDVSMTGYQDETIALIRDYQRTRQDGIDVDERWDAVERLRRNLIVVGPVRYDDVIYASLSGELFTLAEANIVELEQS